MTKLCTWQGGLVAAWLLLAAGGVSAGKVQKEGTKRPSLQADAKLDALKREAMGDVESMRRYYFDPSLHKTYLEQLGIQYPVVRKTSTTAKP